MDLNFGGVSLEAYNNRGDGFNDAQMSDVQALNKALEATHSRGGEVDSLTTASGAPLKVESLEKTLKVLTYSQENIVFWKNLPVLPAYNTVEEYNRLTSYGSDAGGFNNEGELPEEDDSTYVRKSELVKYLGNTRVITHPMTLVTPAHGAVIEREIRNGTLWILQKLERALFEGNADLIPQEFNGFYKQQESDYASQLTYLDSDNVIDLRGSRPYETHLEEASNVILENYGMPTDIFWSPRAGSEFAKTFYPRQRVATPVGANNTVGSQITSFVSQAGTIQLRPDVFMRPKPTKSTTSQATSQKAPVAPVVGAAPAAAVGATVANTKFVTADAGDYFYAVTAFNRYGESALTRLNPSAAVTVVANGAVDLQWTAGAGTYAPTGYRVYRTAKGALATSEYYPLFEVSVAQLAAGFNGAAATKVRDLNRFLPNTSQALMIQRDMEVLSFKQLAPLMKMDLALLGPAFRFMILLYGTPILYAPRKVVRLINIGSEVNATTAALIS